MKTLYIILSVVAITATSALSYLYLQSRSHGDKWLKNFFRLGYNKKKAIFCSAVFLCSVFTFVFTLVVRDNTALRALLYAETAVWLALVGVIDFREKIIPNELIVFGLIMGVGFIVLEIIRGRSKPLDIIIFSAIGAAVYGIVLLIIALIVKTALGMGDVKMFTVLGLMYGVLDTYSILLASILVMALLVIILLIAKKVNKKTAIPMAPFVFIGFMINVLIGM